MNRPTIKQLLGELPQVGEVQWLGLRPDRGQPMAEPDTVRVDPLQGLIGDRYAGSSGKRQVTLIQYEHLAVIASCLAIESCPPILLKRNIAVKELNLLALKDKRFQIGDAVLEYTGLCHPCSRMETTFGPGGYNAVRGHGGITARVLTPGTISIGSPVKFIDQSSLT